MKAAVLEEVNKIKVKNVNKPQVNEDEILVRVKVSAICGTDIRILTGMKTKGVRYPSIIGHESTGVIEEIGNDVKNFKKDDRVGIIPIISCGTCFYCLNDMENVCENREAIGYEHEGGFAEYLKIPKQAIEGGNLVVLPDNITFEEAVIAEPLACCINGNKKANIKLNDTVVIIGGGPIGLMHVQLSRAAGAKNIIVSEPIAHRRKKALEAGANYVIDPTEESLEKEILKVSNNLGANAVIMAIGVPSIVNSSMKLLRKGGTINLFAGFTKGVASEIDINFIHYNEINVVGTSSLKKRDFETALSLIESKVIDKELLVTEGYSLENIEKAILDMKEGTGMKSIVHI